MRYTKELQAQVCKDIKQGYTAQECSEKYNLPVSVILKWNNLHIPEQRAKEIALRKYQVEVSSAEADLTNKLADVFDPDMTDDEYFEACDKISKTLYSLVSEVVRQERDLNQKTDDEKNDAQIIVEITNKWKDNKFIKAYYL